MTGYCTLAVLAAREVNEEARELLQPTLSTQVDVGRIYSARASYVTSFLGGPPAAIAVGVLNARRLGRVSKDAWLFIACAAVYLAVMAVVGLRMETGTSSILVAGQHIPARIVRIALQALGLAVFALIYQRHRAYHVAREMAATRGPNAWVMGIGCTLFGWLVTWVLVMVWASFR